MKTADKKQWIEQRLLAARRKSQTNRQGRPSGNPLEPIAIVGVSGYFPQCMSVQAFWQALETSDSLIEEIPQSRFDWRLYHDAKTGSGELNGRWGGFIPRIRDFDPAFFQMSPDEAEFLDPRQRLLLMSAYHTLEDAGHAPSAMRGSRTGVFIAEEINEYLQILAQHKAELDKTYTQANSMIANRISYYFDFRGPSEVVNTMCSGAAVALHRAVQALRSGDIEQALVGAANLILTPDFSLFLSSVEQLTADNTVHSFGPDADGFVRAEGVASLLLKPLSKAEADGDAIYALIKHSAVNFNGRGGLSISSPNTAAHAELIQRCYREADVDPRHLNYIEAQGMGNPVADIAEWEACKRALNSLAQERGLQLEPDSCRISTLKPFCGHMHSASALGALFKIIGSLQSDSLYGIANFEGLHPDLEEAGQICRPVQGKEPWTAQQTPRLAGLHSYGSGGNNAHLLIEEYRPSATAIRMDGPCVIPVSACSSSQLKLMLEALAAHVRKHESISLHSIARTLQEGRDAMTHRIAFVAEDKASWLRQLDGYLQGKNLDGVFGAQAVTGNGQIPRDDASQQAAAWVLGEFDDWPAWANEVPRVHIPGYQFELKEYWIGEEPSLPADQSYGSADLAQESPLEAAPFAATKAGIAEIEAIAIRILWAQLQLLDCLSKSDSVIEDASNLPAPYDRWLQTSLQWLVEEGFLAVEVNGFRILRASEELESLWQEWVRIKARWAENAYLSVLLRLLDASLPNLPAILSGDVSATELFYFDSQSASLGDASANPETNPPVNLVDAVYQDHWLADYLNTQLGDALVAALQAKLAQQADARIRILEIGAGGAATSKALLQRLQPYQQHIEEYCLSDRSDTVLTQAKALLGAEYSFLQVRKFDVQRTPAEQAITPHSYDFVIASNVLHVTRDVRVSLQNSKALLRDQGQLLLIEMSERSLLGHLSLGLLDGWWAYQDSDLRIPGSPALSMETWNRLLQEQSFAEIGFPARQSHSLGQQLLVAESVAQMQCANDPAVRTQFQAAPAATPQGPHPAETSMRRGILNQLSHSLNMPVEQIGLDDAFSDLGLDSMRGIKLVKSLNRDLNLTLSSTDLFDFGTVNSLARFAASTTQSKPAKEEPQESSAVVAQPIQNLATVSANVPTNISTNVPGREDNIAIIGMSGRFADSDDVNALWEHLAAGDELVSDVKRWDLREVHAAAGRNTESFCNRGSFLNDIDQFDPLFFKISGMDAVYMDPNQRLFLEEAWNALEDAGYVGPGVAGQRCGVYVGCGSGDYERLFAKDAPVHSVWGRMSSILASRIAYYLDLTGPAVPVDTACSSSLVAIHLACQGLWSGETQMALAGGVFVSSTPEIFALEAAGMFSPAGRCHTFDARASGTIPGEGVGVLVLKPLSQAVVDGDHIYGVIRGSGINQDGKTNGITAPSAQSQERLQRGIYDRFGIAADSISMVEAHGTGTKLGDPIEIAALTRSFRQDTDHKNYCAIGSIKTNVGHTQFAAGVAGVIKVLLSFKHQQIPPSLNFESANPGIDFDSSPFFVNTSLRDWNSPSGVPRRAAVSSFGASGTNAHLVIEEAPSQMQPSPSRPGYLLLLSARTSGQLKDQAKQLLAHVQAQEADFDLGHVCNTLLLGRRRFNHRLAGVVSNQAQLITALQDWLATGSSSQLQSGEALESESQYGSALSRLGRECLAECAQEIPVERYLDNLAVLADLLVQGFPLAYEQLFGEGFRRVSLPTYPFERKRYWLQETATAKAVRGVSQAHLHPLLHVNTSILSALRFESEFSGEEFFFKDHVVKKRKILPGVAYLEMAHAALTRVTESDSAWRLKNLVWAAPIAMEEKAKHIGIELFPTADDQIEFEFHTLVEGKAQAMHARGLAYRTELSDQQQSLDLNALREATQGREMPAERLYQMFSALGIDYGPGHRGVKRLYLGSGQILSELQLPDVLQSNDLQAGADDFVLHPSLLDAAVQSCLAMALEEDGSEFETPKQLMLPFALDEVEIYKPCTPQLWAWIRESEVGGGSDQVQKLNIDACDEYGNLCFRMRGLSFRVYEQAEKTDEGLLLLRPEWREMEASSPQETPEFALRKLFNACDTALESAIPLQSEPSKLARQLGQGMQEVFQALKTACELPSGKTSLIQVLVPTQGPQHLYASLARMFKSARMENPSLCAQLIEIDPKATSELMQQCLDECSAHLDEVHIRYREGQAERMHWSQLATDGAMDETTPALPWKDGGVYLITGGAGGLGRLFAHEILARTQDAVVVLSGRSALTDELRSALDELAAGRGQIHYVAADISDAQQVEKLIQNIQQNHGGLNGILHAAGVLRDSYLRDKTVAQLNEVLAPKVTGLCLLDQLTQHLELDFMLLFSSVSAVFGSPGQSDYATANAFMDEYATYRNELVRNSQRHGHTLSVNWPPWKEGGMQVDEATRNLIRNATGLIEMDAATGFTALAHAFASGLDQVAVLHGRIPVMREKLTARKAPSRSAQPQVQVPAGDLAVTIQKLLRQTASDILMVPVEDIDCDTQLSDYGFDSISLTQFANRLSAEHELELMPTVFFEHPTIAKFALYLSQAHPQAFVAEEKAIAVAEPVKSIETPAPIQRAASYLKPRSERTEPQHAPAESANAPATDAVDHRVAIIGMSGRFPMAEDLDAFWDNLKEGRDCIEEIPAARWDWQALYGDPHREPGKTDIKWGGFIDGVDQFDPLFFGISPREAELMDPQQRLLMTYVWQTLEEAGYSAQKLAGTRTGIFAAVGSSSYPKLMADAGVPIEGFTATGVTPSVGPNRMSFFMDWHGPSEPVETACSSSLVAIHRALLAMAADTCDMAVVGGVNTIVSAEPHVSFSKAGMLSKDGRCKTFSAQADGYVRGEGVAFLLLKKLSQAQADGDHIHGVILGSAENHGGRANSLTAPNPVAQSEVIKAAHLRAGIDPRSLAYIEAHGTGTSLGDPVEINGLKMAFEQLYAEQNYEPATAPHCAIGSVKSNIGHLELAAGVAGVIKVLLQMKHRTLVPSLHCAEINPYIDLARSPFKVQDNRSDWPSLYDPDGRAWPRRAGVSSFGFGGVNSHVVLEEYIEPEVQEISERVSESDEAVAIVLSAKTSQQLNARVRDLCDYLGARLASAESSNSPEMERWEVLVKEILANLLSVAADELDPQQPLDDFGLEPFHLLKLAGILREQQDLTIDASAFLSCGSIEAIAALLSGDEKVEAESLPLPRLRDLAYTLQVGREAMDERLGFVASSLQDLWEKLQILSADDPATSKTQFKSYRGQPKREQDALAVFESDETLRSAVDSWFEQGKLQSILGLWVKGLKVDWERLYPDDVGDARPRRISLPGYPFERERYWISETAVSTSQNAQTLKLQQLHPLLHENISDLSAMRFASRFSGREFFLQDHRVHGEKVLPAAAYLEMVRAAVERCLPPQQSEVGGVELSNLVWARPLRLNDSENDGEQEVHISICEAEDGELGFEVHQLAADSEALLLSQGVVSHFADEPRPELKLAVLRKRIAQQQIDAEPIYQAYAQAGLEYGPTHRGIESLSIGQGEALASLVLPESVKSASEQYVLHPSLLDAAIQTSIGLVSELWNGKSNQPMPLALPYALDKLQVWRPCERQMWAWTRTSSKPDSQTRKLDIDLCDQQGRVCVRIQGLLTRVIDSAATTSQSLMCYPNWETSDLAISEDFGKDSGYAQHLILHLDHDSLSTEQLSRLIPEARVRALISKADTTAEQFQDLSTQVFATLRELLKQGLTESVLVQIVCVSDEDDQSLITGIAALLQTAALENPMLHGQLIVYEHGETAQSLTNKLRENRAAVGPSCIRYQNDERQVRRWMELDSVDIEPPMPWKQGGVYLITGGLGGLGRIFATEIASRVGDVTLVLSGRSPLNDEDRQWMQSLEAAGARMRYRSVDVSQAQAVTALIQGIVDEFGALNGILHTAGMIQDRFIIQKTAADFNRILAPKVLGTENLDRASQDLELDFFVLFSSVSAAMGNTGQADYASANAFMDAFAETRNRQVARNQRRGRTLSINWPLWQDGGMRAAAQAEALMSSNTGMKAMPTEVGLRQFYRALSSDLSQMMVLQGDVQRLRRFVGLSAEEASANEPQQTSLTQTTSVNENLANENIEDFVRQILAQAVKLAPERILEDTAFEHYGIDSVMQISIINEFEKSLGSLPKTLLFEHASLRELVDYFKAHHAQSFTASESKQDAKRESASPVQRRRLRRHLPVSESKVVTVEPMAKNDASQQEDIAIIGIAGRYPRSANLDALWENLKAGNNCITAPPQDRWRDSLVAALSDEVTTNKELYGGYLDDIHRFDHRLFGIPEDQVLTLSPELRLFLEVVWETLENGGYSKRQLLELQQRYGLGVGVYVGSMYDQYSWTAPTADRAVLQSNGSEWQIANRVSHCFGLTGPSLAVNSACSSSITAIHLACEALRSGQASMAIAGGVNLTLDPSKYRALKMTELLGSGQQSKSFGLGDGYIPGEGVGAVLLKPLSQALADGDRITALIKSSFLNHGGGRQMYTVPDPKQEAALMQKSMRQAGIDPASIGYVESAANGSALGDPIEFSALRKAFAGTKEREISCALGSVKSNLGHLEAASGISQLSKVCLQLQHRTLVPTIHATPMNPAIAIDGSGFHLQTTCEEWQALRDPDSGKPLPRRSMINSIGAGGSYANLIVEEFVAAKPSRAPSVDSTFEGDLLFAFSAKTRDSLLVYLGRIQSHLKADVSLTDLAYSLRRLNHNLEKRAVLIARSLDELQQGLKHLLQSSSNALAKGAFISSEEGGEIPSLTDCKAAIQAGRLTDVARYWVAGGEFDIYEAVKPITAELIALPSYCFDHQQVFRFTQDEPNAQAHEDDALLNTLYQKLSTGEWSEDEAAAQLDLPAAPDERLWTQN